MLAVLYASYVPAQIPSNMILNRISRFVLIYLKLTQQTDNSGCRRPSYYIPFCVCIWGMTSALTGVRSSSTTALYLSEVSLIYFQVAKGYSGMLAARIFVGIPEAAFYPGAIYLLSRWYTRKVHFQLLRAQSVAYPHTSGTSLPFRYSVQRCDDLERLRKRGCCHA